MSNSLTRDIKKGEVVILRTALFRAPLPPHGRAFICEGGFGMLQATSGERIAGRWLDGSGDAAGEMICGSWIDPAETAAYQAEQAPAASPDAAV